MTRARQKVAVIGSGIAGLSAAWLLSRSCAVDLLEKDDRSGGHSNTVETPDGPVDTGFIVYNTKNYPNLISLFENLDVRTCASDMSFGVSVDRGRLEYAGRDLAGMFAQRGNVISPRYWRMIADILRFYREAPQAANARASENLTLGQYLRNHRYSQWFIDNHIIPMGAAIWSTPADRMLDYPLMSFIAFCNNHGLLQLQDRPQWRTVVGGSRSYVTRLLEDFPGRITLNRPVKSVTPTDDGVVVESHHGWHATYDHVVLACHADQALELLGKTDCEEEQVLSAFRYQRNRAILHTDQALMPKRRRAWCSWNYLSDSSRNQRDLCVTYWMNNLQPIEGQRDYFVTLNPIDEPREGSILRSFLYDHPIYDLQARAAQSRLWDIQGRRNIWFCGSYTGYGFHEDGIQSGLAVAEALGGLRRPWHVPKGSDRVNLPDDWDDRHALRPQEAAA